MYHNIFTRFRGWNVFMRNFGEFRGVIFEVGYGVQYVRSFGAGNNKSMGMGNSANCAAKSGGKLVWFEVFVLCGSVFELSVVSDILFAHREKVKAGMENGVLTVTVPKAEVKKPEVKAIEISGRDSGGLFFVIK
ncbi:hypothetical protein SASPL_136645 [Salvia splendens]|uniref:SHSP domain-containing protein n=1 Tax=Salvia splendens TaxID=180675 RepID=A0A8X8ZHR1_SALSN|nr:hypothetical protein SASPL_136645 [Salvia splendens]